MIVSIEQHVEWIGDCIEYLRENAIGEIEPTVKAEDAWIAHVNEVAEGTMFTAPTCNSWYLGANVPGKPRIFMPYVGGVAKYRAKCDEVVAKGYAGFSLTQYVSASRQVDR
jgi:cyclohexanone monooxygenase